MTAMSNCFVAGFCLRGALTAHSAGWAVALTLAFAINVAFAIYLRTKRVPA